MTKKTSSVSGVIGLSILAAALMVFGCSAQAATQTWTGTTSGNMSGTTANWGGTVPTGTDIAYFNLSSYATRTPTANAAMSFGELEFGASSGALTFGPGTGLLTLAGASGIGIQVDNGSGAVNTGSATFAIGASQQWNNNSANTLTVGGTIDLGANTLTFNGSGSGATTQSGIISGTGGLAVSNGTVNLNGANTFTTGGVSLSGGTLVVGNTKSLGNGGAFTITGGTLDTIAAGITLATVGAENWNGDFTFAGTGALNLSTAGVTLGGNRTVTVNASTLTVGGIINDAGHAYSLTKAGAGTLVLSGVNTYTGGVNLKAGQLNINNAAALGTGTFAIGATSGSTAVTIDNTSGADIATSTNNNTQTWNQNFTFTGSSKSLNLGTGAVTLAASRQVTVNANTLTVGGIIGDSSSGYALTKAGTGTLVLGNANTFSGGVNLTAGTLSLGNDAALGTGTLTISANTSITSTAARATTNNNAQIWNGDWQYNGLNVNWNTGTGSVTLGADVNLTNSGGGGTALTVGGTVTGAHNLTLKENGVGAITIATVNNTGTVTNAGAKAGGAGGVTITTLGGNVTSVTQSSNDSALSITNQITALGGSSTFNLSKTNFAITGSAGLNLNGGVNMNGSITNDNTGTGALTIGAIGNNVTGVTQNSTTSMLILTAASSYTTPTTVTAGTLRLTNYAALGSSAVSVANGAVLELYNTTVTGVPNALTINGNGTGNGALVGNGNNVISYSGTITLGSDSTIGDISTGGTFLFTVSNVIGAHNLTIKANNAQPMTFSTPNNAGTITNSGTGTGGVTLSAVGSNVTGIIQNSTTSALTIGGTNTYTGGTTITAGTVKVNSATALGGNSSAVSVASGAVLDLNGNVMTNTNALTLNGNGSGTGALLNSSNTAATYAGTVNLASDSTIGSTGTGTTFTVGGAITSTGTGNLTVKAGGTQAISLTSVNNTGTITNSGSSSGATTLSAVGSNVTGLTQNSGTSNLILTGANSSFKGDTTLTAGTLQLQNTNSLQNSALNMNGGSLVIGAGGASTITALSLGGLSGSGNINLNNNATTPAAVALTIGNSNTSYGGNTLNPTYSGALSNTSGSASLTKVGSNIQTLSGTNTYTGTTTVSAGTLILSSTGSIASSSAVTVQSAAAIGGDGTINGNLTLNSGAKFVFDLNNTPLTVSGTFVLSNTFGVTDLVTSSLAAIDWSTVPIGTYKLIGTSFVFDATNIQNFGAAHAFVSGGKQMYFANGSLDLVVAVPEPATWALLAFSLTTVVVLRRRRRN